MSIQICYSLIPLLNAPRRHSDSISFHLTISFISFLNFSTNGFISYSLPFTILLNSYTNSSIILLSCSIFFNSTTFIILLSPLLNFFFKSAKNSHSLYFLLYSSSTYLPIFLTYMTTPTIPASLLLCLSFSSWCITYMLSRNWKPYLLSH